MSDYDNITILNEGLESRTTKSGKQRFSIKITAEPIIINTDPKALGAPVAQAIAHHLREKMRAISAVASPATIRAREVARRALLKGEAWAVKRYAGGRMGSRIPAQSDRLFNDSGRFAESIVAAAASDGTWRVNVAANRLDPATLNGGAGAVERIWQRLVALVPAFGNIGALLEESDVVRARIRAQETMIRKGKATSGKVSAMDVAKALADTAKLLIDVVDRAVG